MTHKPKRVACLALLALLICSAVVAAGYSNYSDTVNPTYPPPVGGSMEFDSHSINRANGDPSPDARRSHVNDYRFQPDQININVEPKDGLTQKVLRTDQKILTNEFVSELIPVYNVTARELRPIARAVAGMEGGFADVVQDKKKKQYFLHVVAPPWQLPYIVEAVKALDKTWVNATDNGTGLVKYRAKNRDAEAIDPSARLYCGGITQFDERLNLATHVNDPSLATVYEKIMEAADLPVNMITVEAQFVEVSTQNDLKLGVDYLAWKNGPGRDLWEVICAHAKNVEHFRGASSIYNPLTPPIPWDGSGTTRFETNSRQHYASYNAWLTAAYLDFLQSKGKAKVVVSPVISTRSGRTASWASSNPVVSFAVTGDNQKDLYFRGRQGGDSGDLGAWDRYLNYVRTGQSGTFLSILPWVGMETTEMWVDAALQDVSGYTPAGLPMISVRSVTSEVRVKDGQTLVLAGLKRSENLKQKSGIPLLSDIPILGWLFGGELVEKRGSDILVTLTPTVSVGSASAIEIPVSLQKVKSQVEGATPLEIPANPYGFDQWLLDKEK